MFIQNKYTNTYFKIIAQARSRVNKPDTVIEIHHVIPKALGGDNESMNLAPLLPREHFICHWLLTKMVNNKHDEWKMVNALGYMMWAENDNQERYKVTARLYEQLKNKHSKMKSWALKGKRNGFYGKTHTEEAKRKISEANKGSKLTPEQCSKVSASKLGVKREPFSEEWKANLSKSQSGKNNSMYGKTHSEETRKKQALARQGSKHSEETKAKIAAANIGVKKPKKLCIHCTQYIAVNGYARWHGERCKVRNE